MSKIQPGRKVEKHKSEGKNVRRTAGRPGSLVGNIVTF